MAPIWSHFFLPERWVAPNRSHFGIGGENDMENEKRALSWREFVESGFDGRECSYNKN